MFDTVQNSCGKFDKRSAATDASHPYQLHFFEALGGVSMVLMLNPSLQPSVGKPTSSFFRRILVVDDNRDAAESLAMLLSLTGDETRVAYDGFEALQTAATFKPDVMFLDLGLPKLNGYEVARKVRQSPGGDMMVLIALTGWTEDAVRHRSMAAGFDEHLIKPLDYLALASLLAGVERVETAG